MPELEEPRFWRIIGAGRIYDKYFVWPESQKQVPKRLLEAAIGSTMKDIGLASDMNNVVGRELWHGYHLVSGEDIILLETNDIRQQYVLVGIEGLERCRKSS